MSSTGHHPSNPVWDVVIIGAGPAGAATAITLAKLGQRVLLVEERTSMRFKLGESLSPSAIGLVRHFLGDIEDAEQSPPGLFKTAGNISLWASDAPEVTDFFYTLTGFGLNVDRLAFDEYLRSKAVAAGVTLLVGSRFESCVRIADHSINWELALACSTQTRQYHTRYLVDCSGRRAVVAKALGIHTTAWDDQLFAYAQWFSSADDDHDRYTRIEAMAHGWWYSNRLPSTIGTESRRLVVLHSDKDLPAAKQAARRQGFEQLLEESLHIAPLLKAKGYHPCGTIRGAPAHSQRLQDFCGHAWMAVGDAAQAYDPLSSQGIDKALRTGSYAGHMIHYALADHPQSAADLSSRNTHIQQYDEQQRQLWQAYLSQRDYYYRIQPRWTDQPFWQRRQRLGDFSNHPIL